MYRSLELSCVSGFRISFFSIASGVEISDQTESVAAVSSLPLHLSVLLDDFIYQPCSPRNGTNWHPRSTSSLNP